MMPEDGIQNPVFFTLYLTKIIRRQLSRLLRMFDLFSQLTLRRWSRRQLLQGGAIGLGGTAIAAMAWKNKPSKSQQPPQIPCMLEEEERDRFPLVHVGSSA